MSERPKWAEAIRFFVIDGVVDEKYGWPMEGDDPPEFDAIERAVLDTLCAEFGHEVIDDQYGIPEHRYCIYCNQRESVLTDRRAS